MKKSFYPLAHLFWKTQLSILRACPSMHGLVVKRSMGATYSSGIWINALLRLIWGLPHALLEHCRNKREERFVIARITYLITTRCTLQCDKCVSYIPDMPQQDMPLDELSGDLERLLAGCDYIYAFIISGGEPFLHPDLDRLIRLCAASDKIGDISLQTNGTVVPGEKVLEALREGKVLVKISKYPAALQPDVEELKRVLTENGVLHTHASAKFWSDLSYTGQPHKGSGNRRFGVCVSHLCIPYLNGKLHHCIMAAYLAENGVMCLEDEFIDLRTADPAAIRAQWQKMTETRVLASCSYCLGQTYKTPKIPVAVQRVPPGSDTAA